MPRIWERLRDWILLAVLLSLSTVTMLSVNEPMLRGLRARALELTARVESSLGGIAKYTQALEENQRLREHNVRLNNNVTRMRAALADNTELRQLLGVSDSTRSDLVAASVVSRDITRERNTLVLNVGFRDGVDVDMAVIDDRGVVGKTVLVTERFASVMTIQNTDFFVAARILPSGSDGIVRWDGEIRGMLLMELVERTALVEEGDLVVTGPSNVFARDVPIGVVSGISIPTGSPTMNILVQPFARIDDLSFVFVERSRPPAVPDLRSPSNP
ncbi:MAG: rod shape-determining protein MreC [Bacteroidetes bacterium CG12_big_fil_rev_8_21_14_0_65_60_17]|nr:MAG: rod shape-determining protein MreC [Bacteroidetes bacterium CG12_big_fil_rev_8_21_14_0_65_60_17]